MTGSTRFITLTAAFLGFLGVALGAFGAHALKPTLEAHGSVETWKTAVLYQLVHAVALLALAGWRDAHAGASGRVAALWVAGVVFFSGSLYWLALGGPRFLGPVTPLGGVAFLTGWALLAWQAWRRPAA
ncbi:MAG: DUF423 domain-containing protein [Candidatus Didemnitutus sp.]|nr:DUF423 domain-containing protein [Candidatus Didemnitutus sp.]